MTRKPESGCGLGNLPKGLLIEFSMFFDASVWRIQQKGITIKFWMEASRIDRSLKFLIVSEISFGYNSRAAQASL